VVVDLLPLHLVQSPDWIIEPPDWEVGHPGDLLLLRLAVFIWAAGLILLTFFFWIVGYTGWLLATMFCLGIQVFFGLYVVETEK
jgi:hypothetical protein